MTVNIRKAENNEEEWKLIRDLAARTWWVTYDGIHSKEQLDFMFEEKYAMDVMKRLTTQCGHQFFIAYVDGVPVGFASLWYSDDGKSCELERLYVVPEMHKHGVGKALCDLVVQQAKEHGCSFVTLTVNRVNAAVQFYEHYGFMKESSFDADIGHGWQINAFRMKMALAAPHNN